MTFGDGTKARGFHLAHRFKRPGRYLIKIRATDRAGNTSELRRALRVRAVAGKLAVATRGRLGGRDHRRRHDGSRSRGGPGKQREGRARATTGSCSSRASCC